MIEIERVENGFIVVVKTRQTKAVVYIDQSYVFPSYADAERFVRKHFGEGE